MGKPKTPERRQSDRKSVKIVGSATSGRISSRTMKLAFTGNDQGSLTYTFVKALTQGPDEIDPLFFAMQSLASLLFLVYSLRLKNPVFVAANVVALVNAAGTLVVAAVAR